MNRYTRSMRHHLRLAALALTAVFMTAVAGAQPSILGGEPPIHTPETATGLVIERILVKVNGEIVTQTDLEGRQISLLRQQGYQPTTNADLAEALRDLTPGLIASVVDELLMVQRGRELGYGLGDEQFESLLEGIKEENNFATDEALLEALSEQEGMSLEELRRTMERQMLVNQVQQIEILNKVTITDVEAREYYDTHLEEFTEPASVTLREILIGVGESASGGVNLFADQAGRDELAEVQQRLAAGEDFALVAAEVSDAASKANGGLIGPLLVGDLSESIRAVLGGLEVGQLSEPIRTPQGYQLLLLDSRTEAAAAPFEDVRDNISNNVFSDRRIEEYDKYLDSLRETAIIEWRSDDLRQAYESYEPEVADNQPSSGQ